MAIEKFPSLCDAKSCLDCRACSSVCGKNAIAFELDEYGFRYPVIDEKLCVGCRRCESVCPAKIEPKCGTEVSDCYALYSRDNKVVENSSSGGVFYEFAKYTIEHGGIVFGVISQNSDFFFTYAEKIEDVYPMMGSKYVQADVGVAYIQCVNFLEQERRVLFTGTPCQIAGLKNIVSSKYGNLLLTLEVICHGVPSLKILNKCLDLSGVPSDNRDEISFRDTKIWNYLTRYKGDGKMRQLFWQNDIYMRLFMKKLIYKTACYTCPYAKLPRVADFTMGDFWGIVSSKSYKYNNKGTSVLLVNTEKAEEIWNDIKVLFCYEKRALVEAVKVNKNIESPTEMPSNRDTVLNDLFEMDKKHFVAKYNLNITVRNVIGYLLRRFRSLK